MRRLVAVAGILTFLMTAAPAEARPTYYGDRARTVAESIGCRGFEGTPGTDATFHDTGRCTLRGRLIGIGTFTNARRQARWKAKFVTSLEAFYPPGRYFFAESTGAVAMNKHLTRPAARVAARNLRRAHVEVIRVR